MYFKRKYYNITYDTNGGNEIKSETVKYEETLENSLPTPKKEGYIFDGWTVDDKDYDVTSKVDENVKLVAKWKADTVTYKVDYYQENSDGTFSIKNTEVKKAKTDEKVLIIPTEIYGYEIDTKNPEYLVSGIVKADGSLALKVFYKIKEYSVKYENVKTGETKEDIVKHGENAELEEQEIPEKKGYTFVGWLTQDGELFNPDAPIVSDVSLSLYYTPNTDTPFKVNYYKINDNKEYSFIGSNMYYGTTDTIVEVELKNLVGYKVNAKKSTIEGKILADGTAEFNVYYDVDNPNIVETGDIIYIIIAIIILLFITNSAITVKKRKKVNKKK